MIIIQHRLSKTFYRGSKKIRNIRVPSWTSEKKNAQRFKTRKDAEDHIKKLFGDDAKKVFYNMVPLNI